MFPDYLIQQSGVDSCTFSRYSLFINILTIYQQLDSYSHLITTISGYSYLYRRPKPSRKRPRSLLLSLLPQLLNIRLNSLIASYRPRASTVLNRRYSSSRTKINYSVLYILIRRRSRHCQLGCKSIGQKQSVYLRLQRN